MHAGISNDLESRRFLTTLVVTFSVRSRPSYSKFFIKLICCLVAECLNDFDAKSDPVVLTYSKSREAYTRSVSSRSGSFANEVSMANTSFNSDVQHIN